MTDFSLTRFNAPNLNFTGTLLADVSTFEPGLTRWQEVRIYSTERGTYVTETVGKSLADDEHDIIRIFQTDDAAKCVASLQRQDRSNGNRYFTKLALDAILDAAEADTAFEPFTYDNITDLVR